MTISYTPYLQIPYPDGNEHVSSAPSEFAQLAAVLDAGSTGPVMTRLIVGSLAGLPPASSVPFGTYYHCTDVQCAFLRNASSVWVYIPVGQSTSPIGSIEEYAGSSDPVDPDGVTRWMLCDGRAINRGTYNYCFIVLGTSFGAGDGSTTFNIPNTESRVVMGAGQGSGGLSAYTEGQTGGAETVQLTSASMPSHGHTDSGHNHPGGDYGHTHGPGYGNYYLNAVNVSQVVNQSGGGALSWYTNGSVGGFTGTADVAAGLSSTSTNSANLVSQGNNAYHNNMQPYVALNHIIRVL